MENNMEIPQKMKNRPTIWSSNPTFWVFIQKDWNQSLKDTPAFLRLFQYYSQ